MRENRTYGSEGGEDLVLPDPYHYLGVIVGATLVANESSNRSAITTTTWSLDDDRVPLIQLHGSSAR